MTIFNALLFGVILLAVVFVICYSLIGLYNKNTKVIMNRLVSKTTNSAKIDIKNIKISYLVANGLKYYPSINNTADIYLFDNFLVIFRRQNFIFQLNFKPTIISKDSKATEQLVEFINVEKPDKIVISTTVKGEIEIHFTDQQYNHYKTTITLKGLSEEQIKQLSSIREWSE